MSSNLLKEVRNKKIYFYMDIRVTIAMKRLRSMQQSLEQ